MVEGWFVVGIFRQSSLALLRFPFPLQRVTLPHPTHTHILISTTGSSATTPLFVCPQQPNLQLPVSRLHDGICDCCDGMDEPSPTLSSCVDICDIVLRKEREARAKLVGAYKVGSQKRQVDLAAFQTLRQSKLQHVLELERTVSSTTTEIDTIQGQVREFKQSYVRQRMATIKDSVNGHPDMVSFVQGLDRRELEQLIVHGCQVAGEIGISTPTEQDSDTCVALRMAGLDLALTWDDDDYDDIDTMKGQVEVSGDLVQLLFENASKDGTLNWKVGARGSKLKSKRRRLDEMSDDYLGSFDESYDEDSGDEYDGAGMEEDDDFVSIPPSETSRSVRRDDDQGADGKKAEFISEVTASKFSRTRVSYLERSKKLEERIIVMLEELEGKEDEDEEEDDSEVRRKLSDVNDDNAATFDPAAFTMVRNELRRREESITRGYSWAASAKLLFAFSKQSDENIQRLAVGTLYYGQVSTIQVWQILQSILPEYGADTTESPNDTCSSPWAGNCPPKSISRMNADYPPSYILSAGHTFCEQQASSFDIQQACSGPDEEPITIPTSIPDGYYGYSSPIKRSDIPDDPLSALFAPIDSLVVDKDGLQALETNKKDLERTKKDTEKIITDTWHDIGGKDGDIMGPDGELHSLASKCHEIVAGKYTYEMCLFGNAAQKDSGGGSSTSLGKWHGMDIDGTTGKRVMMWTDGQKCWNGPKRSATVHLACGADNKVISADEPDTCRYVFEMESYIACDDDFKARAGL
jgi:hypothetical protein